MMRLWNRLWAGESGSATEQDAFAAAGLWEQAPRRFVRGSLVRLAADVVGVDSPDGELISAEKLGLGIVRIPLADGPVWVYWTDAKFMVPVDPQDLRPLDPHARLITVQRRDNAGHRHNLRRRVGVLEHHWTVELLPDSVVRAVREDGLVWTFRTNSAIGGVILPWPQPPDDEDAEALAAADLGVG